MFPFSQGGEQELLRPMVRQYHSRIAIAIDNNDLDSSTCRKGWTGLPKCGVGVFEMSTGEDPRRVLVVEA